MSDPGAFIDQIIANAIATADNYTAAASDAADGLISKNVGVYIPPPSNESGFFVEAVEPEIPVGHDTTLTYEAQLAKIIGMLSSELADFFRTYYPLASDAFDEATNWLVNTITNGGTGINADIEDQLWQRARDRVISEGRRLEDQIVTGYAAKGYFMPSGSMLKKIEEARYDQAGKLGEASTTIAAKQADMEIETVKFAIGKAIESRSMAMNAAADYIRAVASAPDTAAKVAGLNADIQARMMSAASSWYGVRLDRDKLVLSSKLAEMSARSSTYEHRRTNATQNDEVQVRALTSAADVFAKVAQASLSSLNTIASTATNAFS